MVGKIEPSKKIGPKAGFSFVQYLGRCIPANVRDFQLSYLQAEFANFSMELEQKICKLVTFFMSEGQNLTLVRGKIGFELGSKQTNENTAKGY